MSIVEIFNIVVLVVQRTGVHGVGEREVEHRPEVGAAKPGGLFLVADEVHVPLEVSPQRLAVLGGLVRASFPSSSRVGDAFTLGAFRQGPGKGRALLVDLSDRRGGE
ncbi:hypothetical protein [Streptomyces sp. NPDC059906]|uniref:hypothetical protein n=1 Tax=Streptomyces sp. NPDC059906 TaxID=3346997 RepID=UPI00365233F6